MKILLWHGYLLGGTGSNVYTRALAREWTRAGHEVTVFSQEPEPELYDLGGARTVRPDVGGLLPVFVLDRYEGYEVQRLPDAPRARVERWVAATNRIQAMEADAVAILEQAIKSDGFASARAAGVDRTKRIGRSVLAAMSLIIDSVKFPGDAEVPINIVGRTRLTTSARSIPFPFSSVFQRLTSGVGRTNGSWYSCSVSAISEVNSPCWSTSQKRPSASSRESPSRIIASQSWLATPTPAVPAPKTTTRCFRRGTPHARTAEIAAASTMAPVPCMSSLNVQTRSR